MGHVGHVVIEQSQDVSAELGTDLAGIVLIPGAQDLESRRTMADGRRQVFRRGCVVCFAAQTELKNQAVAFDSWNSGCTGRSTAAVISEHANVQALVVSAVAMRIQLVVVIGPPGFKLGLPRG